MLQWESSFNFVSGPSKIKALSAYNLPVFGFDSLGLNIYVGIFTPSKKPHKDTGEAS